MGQRHFVQVALLHVATALLQIHNDFLHEGHSRQAVVIALKAQGLAEHIGHHTTFPIVYQRDRRSIFQFDCNLIRIAIVEESQIGEKQRDQRNARFGRIHLGDLCAIVLEIAHDRHEVLEFHKDLVSLLVQLLPGCLETRDRRGSEASDHHHQRVKVAQLIELVCDENETTQDLDTFFEIWNTDHRIGNPDSSPIKPFNHSRKIG
mmetsp:Transcript_22425/g.56263  ORF Transcript_22425/g.56263 Transcript_22425/m.56263 type:complete len:205 (-) Transcript_22425:1809-2423(-)